MLITLTPDQEAWLADYVAGGHFASIEEAACRLLNERIAERDVDQGDDLAWAKADVDEALAAVERGEFVTLESHKAYTAALLASFKA